MPSGTGMDGCVCLADAPPAEGAEVVAGERWHATGARVLVYLREEVAAGFVADEGLWN